MIEYGIFLTLFLMLTVVSIVDIKQHKIKNVFILLLLLLSVGYIFIDKYFNWINKLVTFVITAICLFVVYFFVNKDNRTILGGGDIKLISVMALFLGWQRLMIALFIMGIGIVLYGLLKREQNIPLAPFLSVGTMIVVVAFAIVF